MYNKKKKKPLVIRTPERMRSYILWYYEKYFPSKKRLIEKLKMKTEDESLIYPEIEKLEKERLICEDKVVESKVRNLFNKGKNEYYIISNLL